MWSSPNHLMTSETKRSSHSVEIQQLRLKYSVADIVNSGKSCSPANSRFSSIRCSHDGSHPQPASMYAHRSRGKRSNTPLQIIDTTACMASMGCTTTCHSVKVL